MAYRKGSRGQIAALLIMAAVLFLPLADEARAAAKPAKPSGMLIRMERIPDPQMGGAPAMTVALPNGWKIKEKQVVWNFAMISDPAHLFLGVEGPSDDAYFGLASDIRYAYGQYVQELGMLVKQPLSPADFIKELLFGDKEISDVKIKKVSKPEAPAAALSQYASGYARGLAANVRVTTDLALVEYTCAKKGRRYEGAVLCGMMYTQMNDAVLWQTKSLIFIQAHEGKLAAHEKDMAAIMANSAINPAWIETVGQITNYLQKQKINAQQAQIMANDAALKRQMQETHEHIMKNQRDVYNDRQASMSRVNQGWTDAITGTDRWSGGGSTYSAPTGYGYAWRGPNDQTYYTNDSGFNPNQSSNFSGDWSQMKKVP